MQAQPVLAAALVISGPGTHRGRAISAVVPAVLVCLMLLFIPGCSGDDPPTGDSDHEGKGVELTAGDESATTPGSAGGKQAVSNVTLIEDGLTESERDEFFHLTMGSELFPLRWMQNLISNRTGKPFLENIERFGLVPDPRNADGLPIGLTAADSIDVRGVGKMVGLNCAACHTGIVSYEGASVVIVGGSSLFDVTRFTTELMESAAATAKDPEKLLRFVNRLWKSGRGQEFPGHDAVKGMLSHLTQNSTARQRLVDSLKSLAKNAENAPHGDLFQTFRKLAGEAREKIRSGLLHGLEENVRGSIAAGLRELKVDLKGVSDDLKGQSIGHLTEDLFIVARLLAGRIAFMKELGELKKLNLPQTDGGPGRTDDFGAGRNLLFGAETAQPMTGPCSIPPLFGLEDVPWADWDGNTSSTLGRSMLTALAGGAAFNPESFTSTVPTRNLARLEELAAKLKPPAWPVELLGELDREKITAGEALFREHCAKCHRPAMVDAEDQPTDAIYPLTELGTDPNRLQNYLKPLGEENFATALQKTSQQYLDAANRDAGISAEEAAAMTAGHPNAWRDTNGYAARRLTGIWSTAPYFHNGSVPTLWDVLSAAEERPARFALGSSQFNPDKVGYVSVISGSSSFVFDTKESGNSNSGHSYGTTLSDSEKMSLIEYLKSL